MILDLNRRKAEVRHEGPDGFATLRISRFVRWTDANWSKAMPGHVWLRGLVLTRTEIHFVEVPPSFVAYIMVAKEKNTSIEVKVDGGRLISYFVSGYTYGGTHAKPSLEVILAPAREEELG